VTTKHYLEAVWDFKMIFSCQGVVDLLKAKNTFFVLLGFCATSLMTVVTFSLSKKKMNTHIFEMAMSDVPKTKGYRISA